MNDLPERDLLTTGTMIGSAYRVIGFIGQGGMGYVYKVEHLMMAKVMALKLLRPELVSNSVWQRFRNEALAIARLDHPNIVKIYDMSQTSEGLPFYTMELLVGRSLDDYLIENDQMSVELALPVFRQVCAGLGYAHDHGVIHRDIKPGNIMLINEINSIIPVVKIVDFGIAKLNTFDNVIGQGLTRPGEIMGSPLYMSPEQCSGQALDYRSDMYSVGVTMFHALTGRPPLLGKTAIETTAMHQSVEPPSMSEVDTDSEFSAELEEIVARLMAKSPEDRFDSLADVAQDLRLLERGKTNDIQRKPHADSVSRRGKSDSVYERSGRNVLTDTIGSTTGGTGAFGFARNKNGILLLVTAVLLVAISTFAFYFIRHQRLASASVDSTPKQEAVAEPTPSAYFKSLAPADNLSVEDKEIRAFLKSNPAPYSHIEKIGSDKVIVFEFPKTFKIGEYFFNHQVLQAEYPEEQARGRVVVQSGGQLKFDADECVDKTPQLLAYFRPDDIDWLVMDRLSTVSPHLMENVARLKGLNRLDLKTKHLKDSDLVWLDKLPNLISLDIVGADISSTALAKSAFLPNLDSLAFMANSDITPVLAVLQKKSKVRGLELTCRTLNRADIELIAGMSQLTALSLESENITDAEMAPLAKLKKIEELHLQGCTKLTGKTFDYLMGLKTLKRLKMPFEVDDPEREAQLRKAFPNLHIN